MSVWKQTTATVDAYIDHVGYSAKAEDEFALVVKGGESGDSQPMIIILSASKYQLILPQ